MEEAVVKEAAVDNSPERMDAADAEALMPPRIETAVEFWPCLLYTSPSPRDRQKSRMPSSA